MTWVSNGLYGAFENHQKCKCKSYENERKIIIKTLESPVRVLFLTGIDEHSLTKGRTKMYHPCHCFLLPLFPLFILSAILPFLHPAPTSERCLHLKQHCRFDSWIMGTWGKNITKPLGGAFIDNAGDNFNLGVNYNRKHETQFCVWFVISDYCSSPVQALFFVFMFRMWMSVTWRQVLVEVIALI